MMITHKFRLYPTRQQESIMGDTVETCRKLYNNLLAERVEKYIGFYEQKKILTQSRKSDKFLKRVHSQVLQDVLLRLDKAYRAYFAGLHRFPKFKRWGRYNSFTYPQIGGFKIVGKRLKLSKIGAVNMKLHRGIEGSPKTCIVIRDVDQWYACISAETRQKPIHTEDKPPVGVDLGLTTLATLSDGKTFPNAKNLAKSNNRIRRLQRALSRKQKGSKNKLKTKMALAKAWRKVRRQRDDAAHKTSCYLAENYSTVVFENLRITGMVKNHRLASAILDAAWEKLHRLTAYKVERCGGHLILVEPGGTSQKCSGCGSTVEKDISTRVHICPLCGLVTDRDVNAALNILKLGLEQAPAKAEPLPIIRIGKFSRGSKKLTIFRGG